MADENTNADNTAQTNEGADNTAETNEGQIGEGAQQTSPESQTEGDSQTPDVETLMYQKKHWEKKAKELEQNQQSQGEKQEKKEQAQQQVPQVDEDRIEKIELMAEGGYKKEELDFAAKHRDSNESVRDALQKDDVKEFINWRRQKNQAEQASPSSSAPSGSTEGSQPNPAQMEKDDHKKLWEQTKQQYQGGQSGA